MDGEAESLLRNSPHPHSPGLLYLRQETALRPPLTGGAAVNRWVHPHFPVHLSPSENNLEAKFLGNAPCGHYKFKFPQAMRTESSLGAKVFFFKALLVTGDFSQPRKKGQRVWVCKEELGDYLRPKYLAQVRRFLLDL